MTIEEMRERKKELGYSNRKIAELSGVPLGTVMKIFGGATKVPRHDTVTALEKALKKPFSYDLERSRAEAVYIHESAASYTAAVRPAGAHSSLRYPKQGSYTLRDYYDLPDDRRTELIDGAFYDMAAPTAEHQIILGELYLLFHACAAAHTSGCRVMLSPFDVQLDRDERTMVQPDLIIICDGEKLTSRNLYGAPDLAVEILSPSSYFNDTERKLKKYQAAGVREYWIINPDTLSVFVYFFERDETRFYYYTFEETVPVLISGGSCMIDFALIKAELEKADLKH
ncbi:MAG: Uma2 family endonuclease [Lachnospiraceae bacterium]|nr:Uma2 family endonuclease [Lachnospiraceae bacterium]